MDEEPHAEEESRIEVMLEGDRNGDVNECLKSKEFSSTFELFILDWNSHKFRS